MRDTLNPLRSNDSLDCPQQERDNVIDAERRALIKHYSAEMEKCNYEPPFSSKIERLAQAIADME